MFHVGYKQKSGAPMCSPHVRLFLIKSITYKEMSCSGRFALQICPGVMTALKQEGPILTDRAFFFADYDSATNGHNLMQSFPQISKNILHPPS
jgi:hypothetical protein